MAVCKGEAMTMPCCDKEDIDLVTGACRNCSPPIPSRCENCGCPLQIWGDFFVFFVCKNCKIEYRTDFWSGRASVKEFGAKRKMTGRNAI